MRGISWGWVAASLTLASCAPVVRQVAVSEGGASYFVELGASEQRMEDAAAKHCAAVAAVARQTGLERYDNGTLYRYACIPRGK